MLDYSKFTGNLSLYPHTDNGTVVYISVDALCDEGIRNQHTLWGLPGDPGIIATITPTHPAYNFLKDRLCRIQKWSHNFLPPTKVVAFFTWFDPKIKPTNLAIVDGKLHSGVGQILKSKELQDEANAWLLHHLYNTLAAYIPAAKQCARGPVSEDIPHLAERLEDLLNSYGMFEGVFKSK